METDNVVYMPCPRELTLEQKEHWEHQLEVAERARDTALRMLGRLGVENMAP